MVTSGFPPTWNRLTCVLALLLASCLPGTSQATPAAAVVPVRLAAIETPRETSLDDIVNQRVRVGFSPIGNRGWHVKGVPGRTAWLRIQTEPSSDPGPRYVSLPRQQIEHLRVYGDGPGRALISETGIDLPGAHTRWPDAFVLQVPSDATTLYLEVLGDGHLNLQPRLILQEAVDREAAASSRFYAMLYGALLLVAVVALARRSSTGERSLAVATAAMACLVASLVGNYHLQLTIGGTSVASLPALPTALWVMACAPLVWATRQYSGHARNLPSMAVALDRIGFMFLAIGLLLLMGPPRLVAPLQEAGLGLMTMTAVISVVALAFDPRQWRWVPIVVWLVVILALLVIPLSMLQFIPATKLVRHGFQCLLALQLAIYVLLPWLRQALQKRAKSKRSEVIEKTAEEKIAQAREGVIRSLQSSMDNAAEADVEWIAYRRLMAGLKPVLAQNAAAVIAMNYHNEDLLLVEPKSAEPRFRMLLAQRGSLLKNLSRSLAPQQIGMDFIGPDGPLQQVPLAIIPLPIERPGWGALLIERASEVLYSEQELDLCTEFAALATTAGDEASAVMHRRHNDEIDADTGAYKFEMSEQVMTRCFDSAAKKRQALSVLKLSLDGFDDIPAGNVGALVRSLLEMVRAETGSLDSIVRTAQDELLVVLAGRQIGEARLLAERLCAQVRERALPTASGSPLSVSIGASQLQPGERNTRLMLERTTRALAKARQYGGNQVQAITSATV